MIAALFYKGVLQNSKGQLFPTQTTKENNSFLHDSNWTAQRHSDNLQTTAQQYEPILPSYLQLSDTYNLHDLLFYVSLGVLSSLLFYHSLCGYLQIYYYVLRRNNPESWKCQPNRFLTPTNELHEVCTGTFNIILAGSMSGFLACWVMNDNYSTFYFKIDQYGYPYFIFSFVFIFLWIEAMAYYSHKLLHTPFFYKLIHKHHHRYHSPTPYSVLAMSPFELALYQSLFLIPLFTIPVHALVFIANEIYIFYYGLLDHSGIKMEALWPWQPNTTFHDDHHK